MSLRTITCPDCRGKGKTIDSPCPDCKGTGRAKKERVLSVHIPAGISHGQVVRARGEGEPNDMGTSRGDLHVYVSIKNHPLLTRRGDDLICQVPITFSQAAIGSKINVPTLKGEKEITIPNGSQNGDIITLKNLGMPSLRSGRIGHLHVQVFIEVPKKLSQKQKQLLQEYAKTEQASLTPQRKSFIEKLKEYFSGE